jgi:hypothetical protein
LDNDLFAVAEQAKDQHFNQMVTSKDAKIMNLIEGTDVQRVLVRHQMELEQMRRLHERDIEQARESAEAEQKQLVAALRKEGLDKQQEIDKYHTQILSWEKKLENTLGLLAKQKVASTPSYLCVFRPTTLTSI